MSIKSALIIALTTITFIAKAQQKFTKIKPTEEDKQTYAWNYEIECAGVGTDGMYLVKVYTISNKSKLDLEQAKKNAVHGVIFKGFPGKDGCKSQKAIATNPNVEYEKNDFFMNFFQDNGKYMKYVSLSNAGQIDAKDTKKVGKEYKIGVIVTVSKDALRKDLEEAGIIRGLSSGF